MSVQLTNVKVSLKSEDISLHSVLDKSIAEGYIVKRKLNFLVLRKNFVFTIFKKGKNNLHHINITKLRQVSDINIALVDLEKLNIQYINNSLVIDNITGRLDIGEKLSIRELVYNYKSKSEYLGRSNVVSFKYNNEKFPGIFIKFKDFGTSIVFHSGKVIFIGCKSEEKLQCLALLTHALITRKF